MLRGRARIAAILFGFLTWVGVGSPRSADAKSVVTATTARAPVEERSPWYLSISGGPGFQFRDGYSSLHHAEATVELGHRIVRVGPFVLRGGLELAGQAGDSDTFSVWPGLGASASWAFGESRSFAIGLDGSLGWGILAAPDCEANLPVGTTCISGRRTSADSLRAYFGAFLSYESVRVTPFALELLLAGTAARRSDLGFRVLTVEVTVDL